MENMDAPKKESWIKRTGKGSVLGIVMTSIYLGGFGYLFWPKLLAIQAMELNNIGDFLAGVFGPLAFFWLVLGYIQQGAELRMSRDALLLQARELNESVRQQEQLVAVSREQLHFELDAMRHEREEKAQAMRPNIKASARANGYSNKGTSVEFSFSNVGHDAIDFEVFVNTSTVKERLTRMPSLLRSKTSKAEHSFRALDDHILIEISYADVAGSKYTYIYRMTHVNKSNNLPDLALALQVI